MAIYLCNNFKFLKLFSPVKKERFSIGCRKHEYACLTDYKLSMEGGELKGEKIVSVEEIGEPVIVDLHMVPGILTLKNCEEYRVTIVPRDRTSAFAGMNAFINHQAFLFTFFAPSSHNTIRKFIFIGETGAWFSGTSVSFMYVLENGQVPNQITLDNVLDEVNAKDVRLSWETPFTCSDFRVVVR